MHALRTPDERFTDLVDYPFEPHYADVEHGAGGRLRAHYVDEGSPDACPVLLMHGEPSWSYLYRHVIPPLAAAGHRVIAPDLIGFGRSDKPVEQEDHTYARQVGWMRELLFEHLDLDDVTFFGQDWGGLIGLRLVAEDPDRFARVVVGNTGLPTGHATPNEAFLQWQHFARTTDHFPVGAIIDGGTTTALSTDVIAAYDAPFPDDRYTAGARVLPALVPTSRDDPATADNEAAWTVLERFDRPWLCAFSDSDPITAGGDAVFRRRIPGASGQRHVTIAGGGHFLQEDRGPELAAVLLTFMSET